MVSDDQIGAYWDRHIGPGLVESGMPDDGLQHLRGRYIHDVRANPEALRQLAQATQADDRDRLTRMALLGGVDEVAMDGRLRGVPNAVRTRAAVSAALGYLIGVGAICVTPPGELDGWMPVGIPEHLRPDIDALVDGNRAARDALFPDGLPNRRP